MLSIITSVFKNVTHIHIYGFRGERGILQNMITLAKDAITAYTIIESVYKRLLPGDNISIGHDSFSRNIPHTCQ